jgi:hypothetical protein
MTGAIFHHIMQPCGNNPDVAAAKEFHPVCDPGRVNDVRGFTVFPELFLVCFCRSGFGEVDGVELEGGHWTCIFL